MFVIVTFDNNPYILVMSRYVYDLSVYHTLQPMLHWQISYHNKNKVKNQFYVIAMLSVYILQ